MRHVRLHVDQPLAAAGELTLPAQAAAHAVRVLRMAVGDALTLFNGDGKDYAAELIKLDRHAVVVRMLGAQAVDHESPLPLTLVQSLARGDKMDLIVQKATELGVARIVPLLSERSEVRLDAPRSAKRLQHWRAIATAACEQCGRTRLPWIDAPLALPEWLATLTVDDPVLRLALLPDAGHDARSLDMPATGALLVVGPEGGLGERDVAALRAADFAGLRLGPRILRTETAGLAALAALQALYGDL